MQHPTHAQPKLLYTADQAAAMLEMSRSEIYREMARKRLIGIRIGRSRRFSHAELVRYVEEKYAAVTAGA